MERNLQILNTLLTFEALGDWSTHLWMQYYLWNYFCIFDLIYNNTFGYLFSMLLKWYHPSNSVSESNLWTFSSFFFNFWKANNENFILMFVNIWPLLWAGFELMLQMTSGHLESSLTVIQWWGCNIKINKLNITRRIGHCRLDHVTICGNERIIYSSNDENKNSHHNIATKCV